MTRGSAPAPQAVVVRDATEQDMAAIQAIYAQEVLHGLATFEEVPPTTDVLLARRASVLDLGLPYLAAELAGQVVGYSMRPAIGRGRPIGTRSRTRSMWRLACRAAASAGPCSPP